MFSSRLRQKTTEDIGRGGGGGGGNRGSRRRRRLGPKNAENDVYSRAVSQARLLGLALV